MLINLFLKPKMILIPPLTLGIWITNILMCSMTQAATYCLAITWTPAQGSPAAECSRLEAIRTIKLTLKPSMFTPDTYTLFKKFTFIFNVFVMLQIFNFLNARKIQDEVNIFKNFFNNRLFFVILAIILLGQAVIVTFTGFAFGLYPYYGLNG